MLRTVSTFINSRTASAFVFPYRSSARSEAVQRQVGADPRVEAGLELALRAVLRQRDQFVERPAPGDQVADLVEQIAVVVPAHDERVELDHLIPQVLRRALDHRPERLEGVEQRTRASPFGQAASVSSRSVMCVASWLGLPVTNAHNSGTRRSRSMLSHCAAISRSRFSSLARVSRRGLDEFGVGERDPPDVEAGEQRRGLDVGWRLVPDDVDGLGQVLVEVDRLERRVVAARRTTPGCTRTAPKMWKKSMLSWLCSGVGWCR